MTAEASSNTNESGSATNLMMEALEKASIELDKTVNSSAEQLKTFNQSLEKLFSGQLSKLADKAASTVEENLDDLIARKEDYADKLGELTRQEASSIVLAARDVRQELAMLSQKTSSAVSEFVEEQIIQLSTLIDEPQKMLIELGESETATLNKVALKNKEKINEQQSEHEKRISDHMKSFEDRVQVVINTGKEKLEEKLQSYQTEFEKKISEVMDKLSKLSDKTLSELQDKITSGQSSLSSYNEIALKRLSQKVEQWQSDLSSIAEEFKTNISKDSERHEYLHSVKLQRKTAEVKEEIHGILEDVSSKLTASHKLFYSSLKHLEKKHYDKLERLFLNFEAALAKEANLNTSVGIYHSKATHELKDLLRSRLKVRGKEIVETLRQKADQIESEYTRSAASCNERLETIRAAAIDALDKQLRSTQLELERIMRGFGNELAELNSQLPQIESAGHAASLAVMAYRSAMLSFGSD
jgi:phosphotransferase system IIB component